MQYMDAKKKNEATGFFDPSLIAESSFKKVHRQNAEEFQGLTDKQFEKRVKKIKKKKMLEVAAYMGRAMHNHVQNGKNLIIAPYHYG
jgi:hypothetical protein